MVRWLFPPKELRRKVARREKYAEFSDATPPVVLTRQVLDLRKSPYIRMSPYISPRGAHAAGHRRRHLPTLTSPLTPALTLTLTLI